MPASFNEAHVEQMVCDAIASCGWKYIPAQDLPRRESDVLVEPMLRDALIRLNPCIAETPSHADTVIYKLRADFHRAAPRPGHPE